MLSSNSDPKQKQAILVTGASGFVGRHIVEFLSKYQSNTIYALSRRKVDYFSHLDNVVPIYQDLVQVQKFSNIKCCIHCAAKVDDIGSFEDFYYQNVTLTEKLIDSLERETIFIYISSSSVYSFADKPKPKEESAELVNTLSHYGKTKLLAEYAVIQSGLPYIILRPRAIYGEHDTTLMPRLMKLLKNKNLILPGSKAVFTSLTNISLLKKTVLECLNGGSYLGNIYNVCDEEIYDLHKVIIHALKKNNTITRIIRIPFWILHPIVYILHLFTKDTHISKQSLEVFLYNSILDRQKFEKNFDVKAEDFWNTKLF